MKNPRSILITGASSGIGAALAEFYAGPGVSLALCGRNRARLDGVAQACRDKGADVATEIVDVSERDAMAAWIGRSDQARPLDLVIANAGISGEGDLDETATRAIFAINMAGVLNTIFPALGPMRQRRRGQLALVSSMAGFRGMPSAPAYSASKVMVKAYGEALRGVLADEGIGVSVICPGFVESRITAKNDFPMPLIMSATKAARIIAGGLAKNRLLIAFPWVFVAFMWSLNWLPPCWTSKLLSRLPKKGRT